MEIRAETKTKNVLKNGYFTYCAGEIFCVFELASFEFLSSRRENVMKAQPELKLDFHYIIFCCSLQLKN